MILHTSCFKLHTHNKWSLQNINYEKVILHKTYTKAHILIVDTFDVSCYVIDVIMSCDFFYLRFSFLVGLSFLENFIYWKYIFNNFH